MRLLKYIYKPLKTIYGFVVLSPETKLSAFICQVLDSVCKYIGKQIHNEYKLIDFKPFDSGL